jgi:hypothetical protein
MPGYGQDKDLRERLTKSYLTFLTERVNNALTQQTDVPPFDFAQGFLR